MIPRSIKRKTRPLWLAALGSAAWTNRQDLKRWYDFAVNAVRERNHRPLSDLTTEAKVRAAVSMDTLLRRDPALKDLSVRDGVLTVYADLPGWRGAGDRVDRLARVKGVTRVESAIATTAADSTTTVGSDRVEVAA